MCLYELDMPCHFKKRCLFRSSTVLNNWRNFARGVIKGCNANTTSHELTKIELF
jgi:hypothetical protein